MSAHSCRQAHAVSLCRRTLAPVASTQRCSLPVLSCQMHTSTTLSRSAPSPKPCAEVKPGFLAGASWRTWRPHPAPQVKREAKVLQTLAILGPGVKPASLHDVCAAGRLIQECAAAQAVAAVRRGIGPAASAGRAQRVQQGVSRAQQGSHRCSQERAHSLVFCRAGCERQATPARPHQPLAQPGGGSCTSGSSPLNHASELHGGGASKPNYPKPNLLQVDAMQS